MTQEETTAPGRQVSNTKGTTRYIANPVVSCRVEGKEGAILFNADTDSTTLINTTGLFCWIYLQSPATVEELADQCMKNYAGVPEHAAVQKDIESFILDLVPEYISEVFTGGD